jgi:tetratricopeptide (TPR) repeat protein
VQGQENYEKSIDCFRRYLGLAKHGNDPLAEAQALDSLGNVYHSLANDCSLPVCRNKHGGVYLRAVQASTQQADDATQARFNRAITFYKKVVLQGSCDRVSPASEH